MQMTINGKVEAFPIEKIVGGTMLYDRVLVEGTDAFIHFACCCATPSVYNEPIAMDPASIFMDARVVR